MRPQPISWKTPSPFNIEISLGFPKYFVVLLLNPRFYKQLLALPRLAILRHDSGTDSVDSVTIRQIRQGFIKSS